MEEYINVHEFGNNVYACCIKDVQGYNCGISIELLYRRSDLSLCDDEGRRLYLSDELREKSHQLKTDSDIICTNGTVVSAYKEKVIKIIDSDVFNSEEKSLALSKRDFANKIYNREKHFSEVNIDGFEEILNTIAKICGVTI